MSSHSKLLLHCVHCTKLQPFPCVPFRTVSCYPALTTSSLVPSTYITYLAYPLWSKNTQACVRTRGLADTGKSRVTPTGSHLQCSLPSLHCIYLIASTTHTHTHTTPSSVQHNQAQCERLSELSLSQGH